MKKLHLICNAHIDPVWLWEWEEGAAEAISTFRVAADFCEQYEGFVFNHNEALLYKWVADFEPALFKRIQELVKLGRWHIMGGWYLQPDCNMPSGESFARQILEGRKYFKKMFGVMPTTAINFDPFGHTRGLVQLLKKSGYDSYLFCRPEAYPLPSEDFVWVGYDGSEIVAHRAKDSYISSRGGAVQKIEKWITKSPDKNEGLVLWGIGNHGGGPSKADIENIERFMQINHDFNIIHSTPEEYFMEIIRKYEKLPKHDKDLNPFDIGCYTSQIRIKQKHRALENELYMAEKMASHAALNGLMEYPEKEIHDATEDLLFSEFHDALPGSSIKPVEDSVLRLIDHGLENLSRIKAKAFFALTSGQKKADDGEIPIFIYNPHPYRISGIFECEFQLADQNWTDEFSFPVVYKDGVKLPCQLEKELSNLSLDWRKRTVFYTELEPSSINRFDCTIIKLAKRSNHSLIENEAFIIFKTSEIEVVINCKTGLIDKFNCNGYSFLNENSFSAIVMEDDDDSWAMRVNGFRQVAGRFELMTPEKGTRFSGIENKTLDSVRIIEDGEVRSVIEAVFSYGNSFICQRYKLPKNGTAIEIELQVYWNEKTKMLKLSVPTQLEDTKYIGQVAYGLAELNNNGEEVVSQKWSAAVSMADNKMFACINDGIYGSDCYNGEIRLSLLRSPGYSAHPILDRPIMPEDRYSARIDQGEKIFRFKFIGGDYNQLIGKIDREAQSFNEKPYALSFFPSGQGCRPAPLVTIEGDNILMTAFKKAHGSGNYIIRLFEPSGKQAESVLNLPSLGLKRSIKLGKFEIRTLCIDLKSKIVADVNLMEE